MNVSSPLPGDRPAGHVHSTRSVAMGRRGMIATSQSLASGAGLKVLQDGGNAIDAAITAAAVLSVIEPSMNGIGGDLFALVFDAKAKRLHALDASGRAARRATPDEFAARGLVEMPARGPLLVDVPGVVDGWHQLLTRFGTIDLAAALAPAITFAREGYPVHEILAGDWRDAADVLARDPAAAATFLPNGKAPGAGDVFANPRLAASLALIATRGRDAFYTGPIARAIAADLSARDGLLDEEDLAAHTSDWVDPITTSYRGYDVYEMPPSTQGFVALEMLNILEGFDLASLGHNSAAYLHLLSEAKKIAFADRAAYLADRAFVPPGALATVLSKEYAVARRTEIDVRKAGAYAAATLTGDTAGAGVSFDGRDHGDTIYMTAADGQGNVVSLIQSIFSSFGAGIVAGETGITLHNRGSGFVLTTGHPNQIAPRKRPLHTLVPAMVMKDGRPWLAFGVMGGDNQAQAHVQVLANVIDFGFNLQVAGEAARVRHTVNGLAVESAIDADVRAELASLGHGILEGRGSMGGFQGIMIDPKTGVLMGGSDPRKDGLAIGW